MPSIRSSASKHRALLAISISLNREIISPYSRCAKKGLVYITIISSFSCQPVSCSKCTKANTYLLYNIRSMPFNKYIFRYYCVRYCAYYNLLIP